MTATDLGHGRRELQVTIVAHHVGGVGGMERQLAQLVTGLLESGHRVTVIARSCGLGPHPHLSHVRVPGPRRPFVLAFPWFLVAGTVKVWLHRAGVLHITGALVLNRPDVVTVHFCNAAVGERRGLARTRRPTLPYRLNGRLALWMGRLVERFCYRPGWAGRLVAVSTGVAAEIGRHFPHMTDRTITIPNAVDPEEFRPSVAGRAEVRSEMGIADTDLVALFVGSEWEGKGLRQAIEALAAAPCWRLLVVGSGDRRRFESLAAELDVGARVQFTGSRTDVARLYRSADALVLPSGYEAFPLVLLEGAASGLPLLVTPVSGADELLEDGVNGWFIERDGASVARRLVALEESESRRAEMARAARESALRFAWPDVVRRYEGLYRGVVSAKAERASVDAAAPAG